MNVFIATPCFASLCSSNYTIKLILLTQLLQKNNIDFQIGMVNNQLTTRARNILTQQFLNTKCTHLFFIDADIDFQPNDVIKLLENPYKLSIGLYLNKCPNTQYSSVFHDPKHIKLIQDKYIEVKYGTTGFMCIERELIETIIKKGLVETYKDDEGNEAADLWCCRVVEDQYITEDYHFCYLCKKHLEVPCIADISIKLNHEGFCSYMSDPEKLFYKV